MTETNYENRQEFEMEHWPELRETWNKMIQLTMPEREVSRELKQLVFTVAIWTGTNFGARILEERKSVPVSEKGVHLSFMIIR